MSLLPKTLGIFLTFSSTTVAPIFLWGKGPSFQWVDYKNFKKYWDGQKVFDRYKGYTRSYDSSFSSCKIAILWKYFHDAFLFRCDDPANYYSLNLIEKPEQKENLSQEINEYVKNVILTWDEKKNYIVYTQHIS